MRKAAVLAMVGLAAAAGALIPSMSAVAAPACVADCVATFAPGAQTTWTVPANATDVVVVVAGGAGGASLYAASPGGAGGQLTVDLGTAYNGHTLHILAGDKGSDVNTDAPGGGGAGSYVADASGFIAIAGGGGGSGALSFPPAAVPGGTGGYATASASGSDGATVNGHDVSGRGAVGATPGAPTTAAGMVAYGGTGEVSAVAADGTITPGVGGQAAVYADFPVAQGGGGYAGGGGGSAQEGAPQNAAGAGGGGSGFLAAGLTTSAVAANSGAGSVTFTYSLAPTITAPTGSVHAGSVSSTTVGTLAPSTPFTVLLDGKTVVASGTIDANGDPATLDFTVPAGTSLGSHSLTLQVGGTTVATSPAFTVTAAVITLAATGIATPWWVEPGVATLIATGILLLWWTSRRRHRVRA